MKWRYSPTRTTLHPGGDIPTRTQSRFCLQCDDGIVLEHGVRDLAFSYRDRVLTAPQISGWHCPVCKECEFDEGEGARYSAAVDAFCAAVDKDMAESLRAIRKKLRLNRLMKSIVAGFMITSAQCRHFFEMDMYNECMDLRSSLRRR